MAVRAAVVKGSRTGGERGKKRTLGETPRSCNCFLFDFDKIIFCQGNDRGLRSHIHHSNSIVPGGLLVKS